jgi:hypothetical protein
VALTLPFFLAWALLGSQQKPKTPKVTVVPTEPPPPVPWPQVIPAGLPPFPGKGWVPDSPPSAGVRERAKQLRAQLWKAGEGTHKIEQTNGRWIAYQAGHRGGKHGNLVPGINAYHLATDTAVSPAPAPAKPRPPMPKPATTPAAPPVSPPVAPPAPHPAAPPAAAPVPAPAPPAMTPEISMRKQLGVKLVENLAGKAKGKENKGLVQAYQDAAGLTTDSMYGPSAGYALAKDGLVPPSPLYWPKDWNKANKAIKDWKAFAAQQAALETNETRRLAWEESGRGARMQPVTPYSATNLQQAASIFFQ